MGLIMDFVGGAADAAAEIGKHELVQKAQRERDEANYIRERNLATFRENRADARSAAQREFESSQTEADQQWRSKESAADRKSAESIAASRNTSSSRSGHEKALSEWYLERTGDIDDMEAKGEILPEQAAQMRQRAEQAYRQELRSLRGGEPGPGGNADPPPSGGPRVGEIVDGMEFLGGDPNDAKSWKPTEPTQPPKADSAGGSNTGGATGSQKDTLQSDVERLRAPLASFDTSEKPGAKGFIMRERNRDAEKAYRKSIQDAADEAKFHHKSGSLDRVPVERLRLALHGDMPEPVKRKIVEILKNNERAGQ